MSSLYIITTDGNSMAYICMVPLSRKRFCITTEKKCNGRDRVQLACTRTLASEWLLVIKRG